MEHGCNAAVEHGCNAAVEHGCNAAVEHGCNAAVEHGCSAAVEHGCNAAVEHGCNAAMELVLTDNFVFIFWVWLDYEVQAELGWSQSTWMYLVGGIDCQLLLHWPGRVTLSLPALTNDIRVIS